MERNHNIKILTHEEWLFQEHKREKLEERLSRAEEVIVGLLHIFKEESNEEERTDRA